MELLKKWLGMGFSSSLNKVEYYVIGEELGLSARRVYQIAHGRTPRTVNENKAKDKIKQALLIKLNN